MHEYSLIADLMKKLDSIAKDAEVTHVAAVKIKLGALAHISAEHFREHFTDWSKGSVAEGAILEIETGTDPQDPEAQDIKLISVDVAE